MNIVKQGEELCQAHTTEVQDRLSAQECKGVCMPLVPAPGGALGRNNGEKSDSVTHTRLSRTLVQPTRNHELSDS